MEDFEDFGTTTNGKVSVRVGFVRGSVRHGLPRSDPRAAARPPHPELVRPDGGRSGQQRGHPVDLAGGAAARRGRRSVRSSRINYTAGVVFGSGPLTLTADYFRIDVSDRLGITSNFTLTPAEIGESRGRGLRGGAERAELPLLHQRLLDDLAGHRRPSRPGRPLALRGKHHHQRGLQPHRHRGDRQREGPARRPAACRVRLRAAAHPLERRGDAAPGAGEPSRPPQLLQRLVRLRQRARDGLRSVGRAGPRASSTAVRSSTWS